MINFYKLRKYHYKSISMMYLRNGINVNNIKNSPYTYFKCRLI